jgi:hypothetical protein
VDKLTIIRKRIQQLPIFGLRKWRTVDYETPLTMRIEGSWTHLFLEKEPFPDNGKSLTHPGWARIEITFEPAPETLIKGIVSKGPLHREAAQKTYSIYVIAMHRLDTLLRTSGGVTGLLSLGPISIHEFFGLNDFAMEHVTWRLNDTPWRVFTPSLPKGRQMRNVLFKGKQLVTPAIWGRMGTIAAGDAIPSAEIVELHRMKGKAIWNERKIAAIEASILMETVLRDYGLRVLTTNGFSASQIQKLRDELTFSTLLNILFPLSLAKSQRTKISKHLRAVDALRRLRNDLVHGNISEKDVDERQVMDGIDGALAMVTYLHRRLNSSSQR